MPAAGLCHHNGLLMSRVTKPRTPGCTQGCSLDCILSLSLHLSRPCCSYLSRWSILNVVLFICITLLAPHPALAQGDASEDKELSSAQSPPLPGYGFLVNRPVWEAGLGAGYINTFDYPASKDPNDLAIALPFFIYRGEVFRFGGRGGIDAVALERPRVKLDFSFGASLSAESSDNNSRQGMPDLDFLLEAGPQLEVLLFSQNLSAGSRRSLSWRNKLRSVISTDFSSADSRGLLLVSELNWVWRGIAGSNVDLLASSGVSWATSDLHDFFYSVDEAFANENRPAYRARGGYLGSEVQMGLAYQPVPRLRLFAGIKFESFRGAANEDSPLFETNSSNGFALALVWTAFQSEKMIEVFESD